MGTGFASGLELQKKVEHLLISSSPRLFRGYEPCVRWRAEV